MLSHHLSNSSDISPGNEEDDIIVAPPDVFASENCATPTPGDVSPIPRGGTDSGASTPRCLDSPSLDIPSFGGKVSPLTSHLVRTERLGEFPYSERQQTKFQSSSISHALHEAHTMTTDTTTTRNSSSSSESNNKCSSSDPHRRSDLTKLTIAPLDSAIAAATSRVLSILSNSQKSLGTGSTATAPSKNSTLTEEADNPDISLRSLTRESSNQSDSTTTSEEGNGM